MPLDGILLHELVNECDRELMSSRVDRINQPEKKTITIAFRGMRRNDRVLFALGSSPHICITERKTDNPEYPPMFCMLLRKHLGSARLLSVTQPGLERICEWTFESMDELGTLSQKKLICELMGANANLILVDSEGRIIDSLKRTDVDGSDRPVFPGLFYRYPDSGGRIDLLSAADTQIREQLSGMEDIGEKTLTRSFMGISPLIAREILQTGDAAEHLIRLRDDIREKRLYPVMLTRDSEPFDFTFCHTSQYAGAIEEKRYPSYSELIDAFYQEKDEAAMQKKRVQDLRKITVTLQDRLTRKLAAQRQELETAKQRETLRIKADVLMANLHLLEKGMTKVSLQNYYAEDGSEIEIRLQPTLSPQQNAQKYYKDYNRMKNAQSILTEQIEAGEKEQEYLASILSEIDRSSGLAELMDIRREMTDSGYIRAQNAGKKKNTRQKMYSRPYRYRSSDGVTIYVGRNNRQNEELTLRSAGRYDIWMHTQKIPGAHVIIVKEQGEISDRTLEEAAMIAAWHSDASLSTHVPVDYTEIRNVKKQPGGRCGMVIYKNFKTIITTPDKKSVDRLLVDGK